MDITTYTDIREHLIAEHGFTSASVADWELKEMVRYHKRMHEDEVD